MSDLLQCRCGVCVTHTLHDCYGFLDALAHRGQEVTGIYGQATDGKIFCLKWLGPPKRVFDLTDMHKIFSTGQDFHTFGGHVRYATRGEKDPRRLLVAGHPHVIGGEIEDRGDHLFIANAEMALVHNGEINPIHLAAAAGTATRTECDSERLLHVIRKQGPEETLRKIPGAFTLAYADIRTNKTLVLRDRTGIRPGVLGQKDNKYVMASEDIAFRKNGARLIEDLEPGSLYHLYPDGRCGPQRGIATGPRRLCFFELHYFSHPGSTIDGIPIQFVRRLLGQELARRFPFPGADLVTYLPRCPEPAALAYATALGLPFANIFYKANQERSFIGSTTQSRRQSITRNLNLLPSLEVTYMISENPIVYNTREFLRGKSIIVIDDSIVRGNNSRRVYEICRQAGVKRLTFLSYSPPVGIIGDDGNPRGCCYGVDMHPDSKFISRGRSEEAISRALHMTVRQLPADALAEVYHQIGRDVSDFCTFCIGGSEPF